MPSSQKPSIETKLRALKQILCDIDRYRQKARPPVPVNTKGAKSVLGIREHQNRIKKLKANKSFNLTEHFKQQQPSLWRKCTNYYHDLIKQRNRKPDKLKTDTKRQQDLIVQQYQRIRRRHQRNVADDKIDEEYERLQKKFCPSFQLTKPLPPPKFAVKRKHVSNKTPANMPNAKMHCSRSTYNMSDNITKSNSNLKEPLDQKQNKRNSLVVTKVNKVDAKLDLKQQKQTKEDLKKNNKKMKMNSIKDPKDKKQSQAKSMTATKELKQDQKKSFPLTKEQNEDDGLLSDDSDTTLIPENEHINVEKETPTVPQPDVSKYRITPFPQKSKPQSNDALNTAIGKPVDKSVKTCQEINCALMNKLFYNKMNNNNNNNNNNSSSSNNIITNNIISNNIISNSSISSNNKNNVSETYNLKYKEVEIRREIRDAIEEGKSTDPLTNNLLANVIYKAQREHVPWSSVKAMIDNFKMTSSRKKVLHLLQIQLGHSVFIICTVRTSNFSKLLFTLDKAMRPLNAKFASILQHFTHCCVIEAIVPNKYRGLNINELRKRLDKQVEALNLKCIDIVDTARGEIAIQCLPVDMPNISRAFESKGYKILNSDYGFRANKEIILDTRTSAEYRRLMNFLKDIPDIETITDNVIY